MAATTPEYTRARRENWKARWGIPSGYRYWTAEEHDRAIQMRREGKTFGQISVALKRSFDAVASRLRDYGEASR